MGIGHSIVRTWRRVSMQRWMKPWTARRAFRKWDEAGRPVPAPPIIKQTIVKEFGRRFGLRVFVETGTFQGEMIDALVGRFDRIYSIELDARWYGDAVRRFGRRRDVTLLLGDSGQRLPEVLAELTEPALFWLDAHYSGPTTARGPVDSPIVQELQAIGAHPVRGHVVLIDDMRDFTGAGGYPEAAALVAELRRQHPGDTVEIRDDVLRWHAARAVRRAGL